MSYSSIVVIWEFVWWIDLIKLTARMGLKCSTHLEEWHSCSQQISPAKRNGLVRNLFLTLLQLLMQWTNFYFLPVKYRNTFLLPRAYSNVLRIIWEEGSLRRGCPREWSHHGGNQLQFVRIVNVIKTPSGGSIFGKHVLYNYQKRIKKSLATKFIVWVTDFNVMLWPSHVVLNPLPV